MKPIFRHSTAVAVLLAGIAALSACKDYLSVKPEALYSAEDVFIDVAGATGAVIGAYDLLSGDTSYGTRLNLYYPYDTDEMQASPLNVADGARLSIARYTALPVNAEVRNPFNTLYQGVERSNICIKYIPLMSQYSKGTSADTAALHRLYGEALTLRAQYYFELIRNWGDVPVPMIPSVDNASLNMPNADRNATYDKLLADLLVAEKLVPWRTGAGAASERLTKAAVKGLRARMALYRGGYRSNASTGLMERPGDYATFYTMARQECSDIMAKRGEHTLNPSFSDLWRSINELRFDTYHEIIFEVAMAGSSAVSDSKLGYYNGPKLNGSTTYGTTAGSIGAVPTYFYAFDSTDVRRDITLAAYTVESNNLQKATPLAPLTTAGGGMTDGKFRRDWRNPALPGVNNYLQYNWPILRFADVLLMFAEADNELNGPTAAGIAAVQEVRNRGYGGNTTLARLPAAGTATKADFFNTIANERYLELGGEGIRKYDLIRWNLLNQKLTEARANLAALKAGTGRYAGYPATAYYRVVNGVVQWARSFYKPSPATAPTGTTAVAWRSSITDAGIANLASEYKPNAGKELLPIPQTTIDTNPNVVQNMAYK
ncbi:RagB/SusD family nutrient uptake outer membrane protein [Hymenobacter rubidus]|uniref:RagB/SusD family nutrient uptake outer membrane protein n=1 Tax=Hymenobacter rubidus TaxID=1441626 RepID=UPI0019200BEE|nr:RagB/SusD family nutrient uptake outer membrane protein [Hymenobacter rubidus]